MKKLTLVLLALVLVLSLTACGSNAAYDTKSTLAYADEAVYAESADYDDTYWDEAEWSEEAPAESNSYDSDFTEVQVQTNRKLIYTGYFSIETKAFDEAVANVKALVEAAGGYMESSNVSGNSYGSSNSRYASFVARVPAANYDTMTEKLGEIGNVRSHTENVEDISDRYYDVQAELDSYKLEQERLLAMMEQADKMEDLIALEDKLAEVRYRINDRTSTIKRYDGLVSYSTFNIDLSEVREYEPEIPETFGSKIVRAFEDSLDFLSDAGQGLVIALIFLIPVAVAAGILVFVIILIVKTAKKNRKKKKAAKAAKAAQNIPAENAQNP